MKIWKKDDNEYNEIVKEKFEFCILNSDYLEICERVRDFFLAKQINLSYQVRIQVIDNRTKRILFIKNNEDFEKIIRYYEQKYNRNRNKIVPKFILRFDSHTVTTLSGDCYFKIDNSKLNTLEYIVFECPTDIPINQIKFKDFSKGCHYSKKIYRLIVRKLTYPVTKYIIDLKLCSLENNSLGEIDVIKNEYYFSHAEAKENVNIPNSFLDLIEEIIRNFDC